MIRHLTSIYGDRCAAIIRLMAEHSEWRMPLVAGQLTVGAEIIYVIREEMGCTLADIVIRRTELGADGKPPDAMISAIAGVAADELGWEAGRVEREVKSLDALYQLVN
jgi:glycerol-3-phosphate dehydrogenase